jgi:hypothetical protein
MNNNLSEKLNSYISNYLEENLIFNLIENWKTISTRLPKGTDSIKESLTGQIYGGMIKVYCVEKNKEEKDLSEEELDFLKNIFESRYIEVIEYLDKIFGRYHSY